MEGIAKEITAMQKLPKQFYEVTGEATASGSIFIELDFMKGIVKEMAGMQKPPKPMDRVIVAELREAIQDATDRGQTYMQSFDNAEFELERWCDEWIPAALKALVKHSSGNPVRAERSQ